MKTQNEDKFPQEVAEKLGYYVYRLIDPCNGETFYVGKGNGNRVFEHCRAEQDLKNDDERYEDEYKYKRIRQIRNNGFEVSHVIHRHGMDENTAKVVEAALIDAYPGLTNKIRGAGSSDYGVMHAKEVIQKYMAEEVVFHHKAILININQTFKDKSIYEATRSSWVLNKSRAEKAEVVLSVFHGIVKDVFIADVWIDLTPEITRPKRYEFIGKEADKEIKELYIGKRVPERKRGASNPIWYADPEKHTI